MTAELVAEIRELAASFSSSPFAPTALAPLLNAAADRLEAAALVIEAARAALAEVAADNDSEYGCSHADAAQQALDLIDGWKGTRDA